MQRSWAIKGNPKLLLWALTRRCGLSFLRANCGRTVFGTLLRFRFFSCFLILAIIAIRADAKTVSIVALSCTHPVIKVQSAAVHFFLGVEDEAENDSDNEDEVSYRKSPFLHSVSHKFPTVTRCQGVASPSRG